MSNSSARDNSAGFKLNEAQRAKEQLEDLLPRLVKAAVHRAGLSAGSARSRSSSAPQRMHSPNSSSLRAPQRSQATVDGAVVTTDTLALATGRGRGFWGSVAGARGAPRLASEPKTQTSLNISPH